MISLVMPTYNGETYLREQLDSIYGQTLVPDEVIVVDDCSTDGTVEILKEYSIKYGLKFYINDTNLGYNKNFAKGISLANGDYICLSDQDDVWKPDKVEKTFNKLVEIENGKPACVSSNASPTDKDLNIIAESLCPTKDSTYEQSLYWYAFQGCTLMFNQRLKDLLFPFPDSFNFDIYIGIYSIFAGNRYHIGEPLMLYRQHGKNAIGTCLSNPLSNVRVGKTLYNFIKSGKKKQLLEYIKREKFIDPKKVGFLNSSIELYSYSSFLQLLNRILSFPYFSRIQKFYAVALAIKMLLK